jgi:hypothetical protein
MELYEKICDGVKDFNDFVNIELIKNGIRIIPITVTEMKSGTIRVYYTIEEIEDLT